MQRRVPRAARRRAATATVELAICLPVLTGLVFGAIEACGMLYTTQSLEIAAYEGVRMAVSPTAFDRQPGQPNEMTNAQVLEHVDEVLTERAIIDADVDINVPDLRHADPGAVISVTITAPALANSLLPPWFWGDVDIQAQASMVKE